MASKYSRQHYEDIAQLLHIGFEAEGLMLDGLVDDFVNLFTDDSPRFNADKFRAAVQDGVKNYYARR